MLEIKLTEASKRFQYEWIFKKLSLHASDHAKIAITGSNGSGKSTLLKCLAGAIPLTQGKIDFSLDDQPIPETDYFKLLAISAPYIELPEEFTLQELLTFHFKFKKTIPGIQIDEIPQLMYLESALHKQVSFFSSGMKQRLKLGLCFFSNVPLLLLDEPTSNLDQRGCNWYLDLVKNFGQDRMIFVGSNDQREYTFCNRQIDIENYKVKSAL